LVGPRLEDQEIIDSKHRSTQQAPFDKGFR
jgi:hypothetical protein